MINFDRKTSTKNSTMDTQVFVTTSRLYLFTSYKFFSFLNKYTCQS